MTGVLKVKAGGQWVPVGGFGGAREAGEISIWPTSQPPPGSGLCNGQLLIRAEYPELFARIGTQFNIGGETATEFRLPNINGKTPVGYDAAQTEFNALGKTGGAKTHTLTVAEMPSHSHPLTQAFVAAGGVGVAAITYSATSSSTGPSGGGGAHNNLQPFITLNYIIRLTTDRGSRMKHLMAPIIKTSTSILTLPASPVTSAMTPIPGLSHAITVENSADTFAVEIVLDMGGVGTGVGHLFVDGVQQTSAAVIAQDSGQRTTAGQNYRVSGLASGNHTLEVRAYKSGAAWDFYSGHCTMTVTQLPTSVAETTPVVLPASQWNISERGEVVKAKVAAMGNLTLSGTGQVIDGVTVQAGDIVLAPMQSVLANNGLYVAGSGAWSRHSAADTAEKLASLTVRVLYGNWHGGKSFTPDVAASEVPGTNNIYFEELNNGLVQAQAWLAALNIPHATFTAMALPTVHDPYSMYNPANGTYTTPVRGLYRMTASAYFSVRAAAANHLLVTCNVGGGENMRWSAPGAAPGTGQGSGGTYTRALNAGTAIQFLIYQDGGGTMAANQLNHMVELARSY